MMDTRRGLQGTRETKIVNLNHCVKCCLLSGSELHWSLQNRITVFHGVAANWTREGPSTSNVSWENNENQRRKCHAQGHIATQGTTPGFPPPSLGSIAI